jgi:hypothetical protein
MQKMGHYRTPGWDTMPTGMPCIHYALSVRPAAVLCREVETLPVLERLQKQTDKVEGGTRSMEHRRRPVAYSIPCRVFSPPVQRAPSTGEFERAASARLVQVGVVRRGGPPSSCA